MGKAITNVKSYFMCWLALAKRFVLAPVPKLNAKISYTTELPSIHSLMNNL